MILLRPFPNVKESLRGYLFRVADNNGLSGTKELLNLIENVAPESELESVAHFIGRDIADMIDLLGVVPKADRSKGNLQNCSNLPIRFWNTRHPRFCPVCLREFKVWQVPWELALVVACPRHDLALVDQCPQCQLSIRWNRNHLMECNCGQSLVEIAAKKSTDVESWISARQAYLLMPREYENPGNNYVLGALGLNDLTSLLIFLGGYVSGISAKPLKIAGIYRMEVAQQLTHAASTALSDWPKNFHSFIFELGAFGGAAHEQSSLIKRFGPFYQSLYNTFQGEQFGFLHEAFEAFLREHWPGTFAKRNHRLSVSLIQDHRLVPLPLAAKELHMSRKTILKMVTKGQLIATVNEMPSGRQCVCIDRKSIRELQAQKADWVTLAEARTMLRLTKKHFRKILEAGTVTALAGPKIDGSAVWRFSKTQINSLERSRRIQQ